jgi:8-oxo-dGTP pyrophosphatase MutT (NUDIX family)
MGKNKKERTAVWVAVCVWRFRYWLYLPRHLPILMLKTVSEKRMDEWEFPGGGVKSGETLIQAANRETKEETNLVVDRVFSIEIYHEVFGRTTVIGFAALIKRKHVTDVVLNPSHHSQAGWFRRPEDVPWPGGAPDTLYGEMARARDVIAAYRRSTLIALGKKLVPVRRMKSG